MRLSLSLFVTLFLVATVLASSHRVEKFLTTPAFAWSANPGSAASIPNTITLEDLKESILSLLALSPSNTNLLSSLGSTPEILLLFVEPSLSTQDFLIYSAAHSSSQSATTPFSNVRQFLEEKNAVLLENIDVSHLSLSAFLTSVATQQLTTHITSSLTVLADVPAVDVPLWSSQLSSQVRVLPLDLAEFQSFLAQHSSIGSNGVTDIIVVYFSTIPGDHDLESSFAHDDKTVATVVNSVKTITNDYVAIFTSETAPSVDFFDYQTIAHEFEKGVIPITSNTTYPSYWPPNVVEGLLTTAFLLIILFVGLCCLCYTQTPDRFPEAPREGQPNHQILYAHKQ